MILDDSHYNLAEGLAFCSSNDILSFIQIKPLQCAEMDN